MKFRATEDEIYEQVKKDTKDVLAQVEGVKLKPASTEVSLDNISHSLRKAIGDKGVVLVDSIDEMKEAAIAACNSDAKDAEDNWLLFLKNWMGRLVRSGRVLGTHQYNLGINRESPALRQVSLSVGVEGAALYLNMYTIDINWNDTSRLSLSGKPSRVLNKLFGVDLITYMCQHYPITGSTLELHFAKSYIPELYIMIGRDEGMCSCMSKDSEAYDLDDCFHPTMPYENSKNAVLALLYNADKKRYVGRTIAALELREKGTINFSTAYGTSGCNRSFRSAGLTEDGNMDGMELSVIDTDEGILLPYVDGNTQRVSRRGGVWVVDEDGDTEGSYESGRVVCGFTCNCCEETSQGEEYHTRDDGIVCESCRENEYVALDNGYAVRDCDAAYIESEEIYIDCEDAVYCDHSSQYFRDSEEMVEIYYRGSMGYSRHSMIAKKYLIEYIEDGTLTSVDGEPYIQEEEAA